MKIAFFTSLLLLSVTLTSDSVRAETSPPPETTAEVVVKASTDISQATLGDSITYSIQVNSAPGLRIDPPRLESPPQGLEAIDSGMGKALNRDQRTHQEFWFRFRADRVGPLIFPKIPVRYHKPDPRQTSASLEAKTETPEVRVEIRSVLRQQGEPQDIREIKPLIDANKGWRRETLLAVTALALLALAGISFLLLRKNKQSTPPQAEHRLPLHEAALLQLQALKAKRLVEQGLHREHHFELSEIFRRYLGARFAFPAPDWTTEEITVWLRKNPVLESAPRERACSLLAEMDRIKFAKGGVSVAEAERTLQDTAEFIALSQPKPHSPPTP
jgi:hypothetical protein